jgi:hypothetical protein
MELSIRTSPVNSALFSTISVILLISESDIVRFSVKLLYVYTN